MFINFHFHDDFLSCGLELGTAILGTVGKFQSTLPSRGVTHTAMTPAPTFLPFQSTLPSRGVTKVLVQGVVVLAISIHTPLAGSDGGCNEDHVVDRYISIHTPLAGSDFPAIRAARLVYGISIHTPLAGSDAVMS